MKHALSRKNLWEAVPRPLKAAAGAVLAALPLGLLLGPGFRQHLRFARQADRWPLDHARAYQLAQLRRILQLAYERTPFYRALFRQAGFLPHDLTSPDDLRGLPTIDKDTIRNNLGEMCTVPTTAPGVDYVSTGGTGGVPLHFYIGAGRSAVEYAYLTASWERTGYRLGMPLAVLRGRLVSPDRQGLRHEYDPLLRHHYYSNFHMADDNMAQYIDHVRHIGQCFLHVYPSSVAALARFLRRSGAEAPRNVGGIIAESEIVYPEQRALAENTFGCRYFSCYGQTEKLVLAAECEHSSDYHVWPTYGHCELLDDAGRPVTTPGERGEIVGTGFINTVVPFIRYRTGDRATFVAVRCSACGREHMVIRDISGHRTQEVLIAADGSGISWTALNMHDDTFDRVRQFQFRQDVAGHATLRIVPADGFSDAERRRIVRSIGRKLDGRLRFTLELVEAIPPSPRGKAVYVDQRITQGTMCSN